MLLRVSGWVEGGGLGIATFDDETSEGPGVELDVPSEVDVELLACRPEFTAR